MVRTGDDETHAYQSFSMFIVPTDTPGVNILRDVPTMGEPDHRTGEPGGHAEILYEDVRVPFENIVGGEAGIGQGFALAQKRLGPGRIHHAMRWLGPVAAGVRPAVRAGAHPLHPRLAARREADDPGLDRRELRRAPGRPPAHAARGVDDGRAARRRQALQRRPRRDRRDQVLGRQGALQRDRPGHPDPRQPRLHDRPAARVDVPRTPAPPASTTAPTRCTRSPSPARCSRATGRAIRRSSTSRPAGRRRSRSSPTTSTGSRSTPERDRPSGASARLEHDDVVEARQWAHAGRSPSKRSRSTTSSSVTSIASAVRRSPRRLNSITSPVCTVRPWPITFPSRSFTANRQRVRTARHSGSHRRAR